MDSNTLGSIITNPVARKVIYSIYVVAGLALGSIQAWYGDASPEWLPQYLAVYGYLGIPVGGLAIANTNKTTLLADAVAYDDSSDEQVPTETTVAD